MRYYRKRKRSDIECIIIVLFVVYILYKVFFLKQVQAQVQEINYKLIFIISMIFLSIILIKPIFSYIKKKKLDHKNKKKYIKSSINTIDKMEGIEFENYLKIHFEKKGYSVKLTPASNDYGADLILYKSGEKIAVQAKRCRTKIGNAAIQEVVAAIGYYSAKKGIVVTNSFFTANAVKLAKANDIELWDRTKLIEVFRIEN